MLYYYLTSLNLSFLYFFFHFVWAQVDIRSGGQLNLSPLKVFVRCGIKNLMGLKKMKAQSTKTPKVQWLK